MSVPNPGSRAALDAGCRCPVIDNGHGLSTRPVDSWPGWWITAGCPLHDKGATS